MSESNRHTRKTHHIIYIKKNNRRHTSAHTQMSHFDFKQFRIYHDHCAMKVGTDGILLGAWANLQGAKKVLDIGCGSGLIALMAAQRCNAQVTGIEIDPQSATQAQENCTASPFADRINVICADIRKFRPEEKFDCLLSNPPYFEQTLLPPDPRRATARHTDGLSFAELLQEARRLMSPEGCFQIIIPYDAAGRFCEAASQQEMYPTRRTDVATRAGKKPKRTLLCLAAGQTAFPIRHDNLILCHADGSRSREFTQLTKDFYLDISDNRNVYNQ